MSYKIKLSEKEISLLKHFLQEKKKSKNTLKRIYCLLLKNDNFSHTKIAFMLNVNIDTVTDWLKLYLKKGIDGILEFRYHERRKSSLHAYKTIIKKVASRKSVHTIVQLQKILNENYRLKVEHSWLYRYCRKNTINLKSNQVSACFDSIHIRR